MHKHLLTEDDLKNWTGYTQRSAITRWLNKNGIHHFVGSNNTICTTIDAVNSKLNHSEEQHEIFFA